MQIDSEVPGISELYFSEQMSVFGINRWGKKIPCLSYQYVVWALDSRLI